MTLEEIKKGIEYLEDVKDDFAEAHCHEDFLCRSFVEFVSEGNFDKDELVEIAKELLKSLDIDFNRHCA